MHTIYITSQDNERLRRLLLLTPYTSQRRRDLEFLRGELDRASLVADPSDRPSAIRIGSRFEFIDTHSGEQGAHTLCLPQNLAETENGLSVASRFGAAVIGCSTGDEVRWNAPVGRRCILIRAVTQPDPSGKNSGTFSPCEAVAPTG